LSVFPDCGGLGVAISLLLYLYVSATVLLFGSEVNAMIPPRAPEGG